MKFAILDSHGNPIVVKDFDEVAELATALHAGRFWQRGKRKLIARVLVAARDELIRELRAK